MSKPILLAEALLRRKELQQKLENLKQINMSDLFEMRVKRVNVTENVDEVTAGVPKLTASQVTKEFDSCARKLRLIDAAIQQSNWTAVVEVDHAVMDDYDDTEDQKKLAQETE